MPAADPQPSRLEDLRATRDRLRVLVREAEPQYVAALAGRLQAVLAEIDELDPPAPEVKGTPLDEVKARRAARGAAAPRASRAGGR
jgi:hypothetical protein